MYHSNRVQDKNIPAKLKTKQSCLLLQFLVFIELLIQVRKLKMNDRSKNRKY